MINWLFGWISIEYLEEKGICTNTELKSQES